MVPLPILDPWSFFEHKELLDKTSGVVDGGLAPTWVGKEHVRRLNAYNVCDGLVHNVNRFNLSRVEVEEQRNRREYGDAGAFINAVRSAVLGESFTWQVEGAGGEEPREPDAPPEENPNPGDVAAYERALEAYQQEVRVRDLALERQRWVEDLSDKLQMTHNVIETETDAQTFGSGIYVAAFDYETARPTVELWDPGSYFPVLDDRRLGRYPRKVHLAYEYEERNRQTDAPERFVRRVTYELVRIDEAPVRDADGNLLPEAMVRDAVWDEGIGAFVREYPYADEPSEWVCLMTDATWRYEDLGERARHVDDFTPERARYALTDERVPRVVRDLDTGKDYIPVVHAPNTVAKKAHYGTSSLALVAQLFDDLQLADTDLQESAALAGGPILAVKGTPPTQAARPDSRGRIIPSTQAGTVETYRPRQVWFLGDNGGMDVLDTSQALVAVSGYVDRLMDRLSQISRMPKEALGRVDSSQVPSGFAMLLGFTPMRNLVSEMRLPRKETYPLLWKFLQREAIIHAEDYPNSPFVLQPGTEVLRVEMQFGQFLPNDLDTLIVSLAAAVAGKVLSRETAVGWLKSAGAPIEKLDDELRNIRRGDPDTAMKIAEAVQSEGPAADYLEVDRSELPERQTVISAPAGALGAVQNPDEEVEE